MSVTVWSICKEITGQETTNQGVIRDSFAEERVLKWKQCFENFLSSAVLFSVKRFFPAQDKCEYNFAQLC